MLTECPRKQIWDVCNDQDAVDLVREVHDPILASKQLVDLALRRFSTDNLSCMIIRLESEPPATLQTTTTSEKETEPEPEGSVKISEAEKIILETKRKIAEGTTPAVGVSGSNSGRGHDASPVAADAGEAVMITTLDEAEKEEREPQGDRSRSS